MFWVCASAENFSKRVPSTLSLWHKQWHWSLYIKLPVSKTMALSNLKSLKVFDTPGDTHVARAMAWKKKKGGISVVYVLSKWRCNHVGWLVDRPTGSPRKCAIVVTLSLLFSLSISVCLCALEQLTTMSRTAFCRNCRCVANKSSLNWVCRNVVTFSGAILGEIVHTLTSAVTMDYLHEWMLQPWVYMWEAILCVSILILYILYIRIA